ncbi:hypothetical protein PPYR_01644, partial [Photinus pyralis]
WYEKKRQWWVKPWLGKGKGNLKLRRELLEDKKSFKNFLRMDETTFNDLLKKITPKIEKQWYTRECASAEIKLIITLRYLATGESYRSLMYNYRIHERTISIFVPQVCRVIYDTLKVDYLKIPTTAAEWLEIAKEFEDKWNMANVIGALDGKHLVIKSPGGSSYYNYKGQHSIVLLAM